MDRNNLIITVAGAAGSGKSRIASILTTLLLNEGFEVSHQSEGFFNDQIDDILEHIKQTRKITIIEQQLNRTCTQET